MLFLVVVCLIIKMKSKDFIEIMGVGLDSRLSLEIFIGILEVMKLFRVCIFLSPGWDNMFKFG